MKRRPDILFVMTDQQRYDTIAALGNGHICTPNLDRLVRRGVSFTNAYSCCPVCVAARYAIRTGREPLTTLSFANSISKPLAGQPAGMEERCGPYLARTMHRLGYRTFGIGKFHTIPGYADLGFEIHLNSEELYGTAETRRRDAFARFISEKHPEYDWIEQLQGERTEMYYMPQMSPLPREITVESWAADRAVECLRVDDPRPYFGFVSFVGPHPPFAPPIPFNRMYDPDRMPNPVKGDRALDLMDAYLPWMNHAIWAEDINDAHARVLKARYYGEISYIDWCLGRILDEVEKRGNADNTVICFFTDHGDHLGDHHAWQKESFFEASCRIPFLVSWPARVQPDVRRRELVGLTDLFGIATGAAGSSELRDGIDLLGALDGKVTPRKNLFAYYGNPGSDHFKIMVREGDWKYIFMANGGREQLFNLAEDPDELVQRIGTDAGVGKRLRHRAIEALRHPGGRAALESDDLKRTPFRDFPPCRIYQFAASRGVSGFPADPASVLANLK